MREKVNILNLPFIVDMRKICDLMYKKGWNERNGGNVSCILDENELAQYDIDLNFSQRIYPLEFSIPELANMYFLITGTGKYLKNVFEYPKENLGIIKILEDGTGYKIIWGLENAKPTSEISTHLLCHKVRLKIDPLHRIIIHNHATNIEAMTFIHNLTDKDFTKCLWKMQTESIVVFPEGIGVLPWMLCGSDLIGKATAEKMSEYRLVVWAHHGILGAGRSFDETFGLIETAEKAAEIFIKIAGKEIKQTIKDEELLILAKEFNVNHNKKFFD